MAYSSIVKPTDYFNTKLYTGNGTNPTSITGVGFQPDWLWIKRRDSSGGHNLYDAVRGSTKRLESHNTGAEATTSDISSFDSDGFTVNTTGVNTSSATYASWNWLASGSTASNTDGSITSTVSANTTAGFSIVSYTGTGSAATIGHGLGSTPQVIIIKNRSATFSWEFGHSSIGFTKKLKLDTTSAEITDTGAFNNTAPTSSVYTVGNNSSSNGSGNNMIAYCFAEKTGYSKFGSYTGNNNTDGTFIYTGFKPAWVLLKISSGTTGSWTLFDNKRDTFNEVDNRLFPNADSAESDGNDCDFLSNGFKHRTTGSGTNGNGYSYIYMAFAENPFVANDSGTAVPVTAR